MEPKRYFYHTSVITVFLYCRDSVQNGVQDLSSTGKSNNASMQYREDERKVEQGKLPVLSYF